MKVCAPAEREAQSGRQVLPTMLWPGAHCCTPIKAHWIPFQTWPAGQAWGATDGAAVPVARCADTQELSLPGDCPGAHTGQGFPLQIFVCSSGAAGFGPGSWQGSLSQFLRRRPDSGTFELWSFAAVALPSLTGELILRSAAGVCACGTARLESDSDGCEAAWGGVAAVLLELPEPFERWPTAGLGAPADEFTPGKAEGELLEGLPSVCR
jgi:hypothetical protein